MRVLTRRPKSRERPICNLYFWAAVWGSVCLASLGAENVDLPVAGIILGLVTAAYLDAFAIGFDLPLLLCRKLLHPSVQTSPLRNQSVLRLTILLA